MEIGVIFNPSAVPEPLLRALTGILLTSVLAGCSFAPSHPSSLHEIELGEAGYEGGGEFCRDFRMTAKGVSAFFKRAALIDTPDLHASFDYLPCYIRGHAFLNSEKVEWEIRAGGTGKLITQAGRTFVYGCTNCDDRFGGWK